MFRSLLAALVAGALMTTGLAQQAQADPNVHGGSRALRAATQGLTTGWKNITQPVAGATANTTYDFGIWLRGTGALTVKVTKANGDNLQYLRPKATGSWTYVSSSFATGTYSGQVVFTVVDSAVTQYPAADVSGTMYLDDAYLGVGSGPNLLQNSGFEAQLAGWGGDRGTVFTRYPDQSGNPPAEQYHGVNDVGVYAWDRNPAGVTDFGSWVGRTPALAEEFLAQDTWSDLEGGDRLAPWSGTPYAHSLLLAAYPFPKSGGSLAAAADGDYNAHYATLGRNLVSRGLADTVIRFGHEFNGGWYVWTVGNQDSPDHEQKCADFAEAFRQFVTTMRSIPGQHFRFVWNPSASVWGVDLPAAFPGRDYVDFVGIDHYDQTWAQDNGTPIYGAAYQTATPAERLRRQQLAWNAEVNDGNWGLNMIAGFAADQGVPLGLPEWGIAARSDGMGGGDNPYFVQMMHDWITANNVAWHVYFNVSAPDGDHDLYDTVAFPRSSAKFSALWNPAGAPHTAPAITPAGIPGVTAPYRVVEGESGTLTGPAFRYHGDPWASGGKFAVMYRDGNALAFTGTPAATRGVAIVYQGWQSDQRASLYVNGALVKKGVLFPQHGRSWSHSYGSVVLPDVTVPANATVQLRIDADDVLPNVDSLKIDYLVFLQ
ncbi:glycosyl hydrolase [Actinophytocola oryzae]|uniref:Glycosyl hydrolase family 26 n=1 Tax=Actinophytocola oryzae TaxID=502181 RepID=A0A4V3FT25_9PSEU|nr:glycosyl hydrolase [Actinophytocola oryzae]TDV49691.1 glycosyl hydrolase family 26 [Actinophytocola oryzae]